MTDKDKYRWHDLRKDPTDLPPSRGEDGSIPDSYEMVVEFPTDVGCITAQGQGWLNDSWKGGTGFLQYASQLVSEKLVYYHDKPIPFAYGQLIAWRFIEPFEVGCK